VPRVEKRRKVGIIDDRNVENVEDAEDEEDGRLPGSMFRNSIVIVSEIRRQKKEYRKKRWSRAQRRSVVPLAQKIDQRPRRGRRYGLLRTC
jgi:hypothetical protein